jgi:hypothetical protein
MKFKNVLFLAALAFLAACDSEVTLPDSKSYPCVGAFAEEDRLPNLRYRASTTNIVVGLAFVETVFVPVIVLLDETYCPVGFRDTTKKTP